jgi:predicted transcriptional regulator
LDALPARDDARKVLGPLEAEVMRAVWRSSCSVTVRDLVDELNRGRPHSLAYTTVMTVMSRLVDKRALTRRRQGRGYVYEAAVGDAAGIAVRNVMRDFGDAAVAHLVEEARANPALLRRLERLLGEDREA